MLLKEIVTDRAMENITVNIHDIDSIAVTYKPDPNKDDNYIVSVSAIHRGMKPPGELKYEFGNFNKDAVSDIVEYLLSENDAIIIVTFADDNTTGCGIIVRDVNNRKYMNFLRKYIDSKFEEE